MGVIDKPQETNMTYLRISGKEGKEGMWMWVKGEGYTKKVFGITGLIISMRIQKKDPPGYDSHYEWQIIIEDNKDGAHYQLAIKEGTRAAESFANTMLTAKHGGVFEITTWMSSKGKGNPVYVSVKEDTIKLERQYTEWDEANKTYKGVPPKGDGRNAFWRDKLFGTVYPHILGSEWDGEILPDNNSNGNSNSAPVKEHPEQRTINRIVDKAKTLDFNKFLAAWKNIAKACNEKLQAEDAKQLALTALQQHLDNEASKAGSGSFLLKLDGNYEEEEDFDFGGDETVNTVEPFTTEKKDNGQDDDLPF